MRGSPGAFCCAHLLLQVASHSLDRAWMKRCAQEGMCVCTPVCAHTRLCLCVHPCAPRVCQCAQLCMCPPQAHRNLPLCPPPRRTQQPTAAPRPCPLAAMPPSGVQPTGTPRAGWGFAFTLHGAAAPGVRPCTRAGTPPEPSAALGPVPDPGKVLKEGVRCGSAGCHPHTDSHADSRREQTSPAAHHQAIVPCMGAAHAQAGGPSWERQFLLTQAALLPRQRASPPTWPPHTAGSWSSKIPYLFR